MENQTLTIKDEDLDEIQVWKKREAFMALFFNVHESSKTETTLATLNDSYRKAELIWTNKYKGRAYASEESFLRTYYYYLDTKKTKTKPFDGQLMLFEF